MVMGTIGQPSRRKDARRPGNARTAARLALITDPRIDHGVHEVHREVDGHDHHAAEDDGRLHHREVTEGDALVKQAPHARPGEDRLDDDGDVDHQDEVDTRQRQHGNQRVLERVLADHERLRQALEARELDVLGAQHLQHRAAREPHVRGREVPPEREGRHQHVPRGARAGGRQPAEIDGEEEDEQEPHPERRHRQPQQREDLAGAVPPAVHAHGGQDAARDADGERERHRDHRQQQRVRQPLEVELEHRGAVIEGPAEVGFEQSLHEDRVLLGERTVEAEVRADRVDVGLARAGLDEQNRGIAGEPDEDEDRRGQHHQREQRVPDPSDDESFHGLSSTPVPHGQWPRIILGRVLSGIRVLDLSRVIAGPYCATLMADLGADVVKLERPGRGDDLRAWRGGDGMSAAFAAVNRGKRGIAVELQHPEGARLAFELTRRADVVIENFLPGVAAKLGLGYAAVHAINPRVVYASVTGFGQTGPYARRPGYNTIAQGMSGLMALTGMPGHPPTRVGGSISDLSAAWVAFGMVNAALVHRERTGRGQHLDVNLLASSMALLPDPASIYLSTGVRPTREGNRNPALTPAEAFPTADGWLNVVLLNPDQYTRLTEILEDPELKAPRFATNDDRIANYTEFRARMEVALGTATTAQWVERMEKAQIA